MIGNFLILFVIGIVFLFMFRTIIDNSKDKNENIKSIERNTKNNNSTESTLLGLKRRIKVYIKNSAKHIFVCGTTGAGKTVTLSNFINSIFKYDYPALIVDGKGDTDKDSLIDIVHKLNERYSKNKTNNEKRKVYVIDMNDPINSDKYNPFNGKSATVIKDMLISMTDWSEEHYKLNASRYIQKVVSLMIDNNTPLNFEGIINNLDVEEYKKLSMNLVNSKKISKAEHLKNVKLGETCKTIIDGAVARFSSLLESDIGVIFDEGGISIPEALNEKAIIVFLLNSLTYPEISPLFGRLITIDAKQGVNSLFHKLFKRVFFVFDEISEYVSDQLLLLVNQSRSANITSILASQSLSDIDKVSESLRKQVIENCNNYIIMRQNEPSNADIWSETIGTRKVTKFTRQVDEDGISDKGSMRDTREFIYHPDIIKNLDTGEAIFISKDEGTYAKIKVNKPF